MKQQKNEFFVQLYTKKCIFLKNIGFREMTNILHTYRLPGIDLSIYRSIDLSIYRSIDLSIYLSMYVSMYIYIYVYVYIYNIYIYNFL